MSILSTYNLGLSFGARDVFSGISVNLPNDAKVGLVGPNGVGKTSLFRILAGVSPPTRGSVHLARGARIGYLRQEAVEAFAGHAHTVFEEMLTVFSSLRAQAERLRALEGRMEAGEATEDLLARYGEEQEAFEHAGGYDYEDRIKAVLQGLGFGPQAWSTPISHLSGGQKTRALLARLLLEAPSLLILDEPTNHLDVQAVEWLERALRSWKGALLLASHDRYFLDRVVDRIWEMSPSHVEMYRGTYSQYVQQRQERWERNEEIFDAEMERLAKEMELIRRYLAWRKIDEAKGKLKLLSRKLVAIEQHGVLGIQGKSWSEMGVRSDHLMSVDEAHSRIKAIKRPAGRPPLPHVRLKTAGRSGQIVLRTRNLQVGYAGKPLFDAGDLHLERLERVALIGPNGSGKTTFLRTLIGQLEPVSGEIEPGASLKVGYFAQAHDSLNLDNSVIDELLRHRQMSVGDARKYLAQYLCRGDDVWKPVGALSGGERGRLALAILGLEGVNLLLLDEPTNHLDIPAQEVLQEGLERFDGTLLIVSHDRYLVDALATQIWELRDGRLHVFKGTYAELMEAREREEPARTPAPGGRAQPADRRQASPNGKGSGRSQNISTLETRIAETEEAMARLERDLQAGGESGNLMEVRRAAECYAATRAELDELMTEWLALAD